MKTGILYGVFVMSISGFCNDCVAQVNIHTNAPVAAIDSVPANLIFNSAAPSDTAMTDLPCGPNIFYSVDNAGAIRYHQLGATSITTMGTLMTRPFCGSLAVNNNFSGGNPDPTFYQDTMMGSGVHAHRYYDANGNWNAVTPLAPSNMRLANCGGYGPYCYFMSYQMVAAICQKIYRYDGLSWQMIYDCSASGRHIIIADLGVDQNGNLIILENYPSAGYVSDSLYVISPTGQILAQHAFQLDLNGAYGAIVINSAYHIGFSSQNPIYPNQLVPFYITSGGVITGVPYTFAFQTYYDLASCEPGVITGTVTTVPVAQNLFLWPVPATVRITFELDAPAAWQIFAADGREVMYGNCNGTTTIDIEELPAGMYVMILSDENGVLRSAKFMRE